MSRSTNAGTRSSEVGSIDDRHDPANGTRDTARNRLESKHSAFTGEPSWSRTPNSPSGPTRSILSKGGSKSGAGEAGGRSSVSSTSTTNDHHTTGWNLNRTGGVGSNTNNSRYPSNSNYANKENFSDNSQPNQTAADETSRLVPIRERSQSGGFLVSTTESRLETTFEPSGEIVQFDVNQFLSRTLSNYDLSDKEDIKVPAPLSTTPTTDRDPLRIAQVKSPSSTTAPYFTQNKAESDRPKSRQFPETKTFNNPPESEYVNNPHRNSLNSTSPPEMPRKSTRQVTSSSTGQSSQTCAYCGQKSSSLIGRGGIYCRDCLDLTQNSPEITRRLLNSSTGNNSSSLDHDTTAAINSNSGNNAGHSSMIHTSSKGVSYRSSNPPVSETSPSDYDSHVYNNPLSPTEVTSLLPHGLTQTPVIIPDGIESECSFEQATTSKGPLFSSSGGQQTTPGGSGSKRMSLTSLTSQSSASRPVCRICQLPGEPNDALISPCRCSGTMQHVHKSCLVHWLEISTRKVCPSPKCELCSYQYKTHHCFKVQRLHMPECGTRDRILHIVFVLMLMVMVGCAALSIVFLQGDKGNKDRSNASLTGDDVTVISCSILFFLSFFVAVFTQYRAEASLCTLCFRCWLINKHWRIKNYDTAEDKAHWVVAEECV